MAPKHHPTPLSGGDRKALTKELGKARAMTGILAAQSAEMRAKGEAMIQQADELTLDPPDATSDQAGIPLLDEDYLILSTIHSAKGQEWKSVYLLNVVDGCMPSDLGVGTSAEIEEERRLLYVAMTRAKDDLHLVVPQRFFVHGQHAQGDRHLYASMTRFIPEKLLGLFERTAWPLVPAGTAARSSQGPKVDIGARMRGMWR